MDTKTIKKTDVGLAGAVIVLAQVLASFQSSKNLSEEMDKLRSDFRALKSEQEVYFVKREELNKVSIKLDKLAKQLRLIRNGGDTDAS